MLTKFELNGEHPPARTPSAHQRLRVRVILLEVATTLGDSPESYTLLAAVLLRAVRRVHHAPAR